MKKAVAESRAGKRPVVSGVAYSGGKMDVPGFGTVVVDLAGLDCSRPVPLLANHENRTGATVGSVTARVEGGRLFVEGRVTAATDAARDILGAADNGHGWQLSIGAAPLESKMVRKGENAQANGRTFEGPFRLIARSSLREVSVVPAGADAETLLTIRASFHFGYEEKDMDANDGTVELKAAAVAEERERIDAIQKLCRGEFPDTEREAIRAGWTLDEARTKVLKRIREERPQAGDVMPMLSGGVPAVTRDVLAAAFCLHASGDEAASGFDDKTLSMADALRARHVCDLFAMGLRASGENVPSGTDGLIRAALSSSFVTEALTSSLERTALAMLRNAPPTWQEFCTIRNVSTFHEGKAIRPAALPPFQRVPNGGELKHGVLGDEAYAYHVDQFGEALGVSRKDLVNDDLGVLTDAANSLVSAGLRSLADHVYGVILAGTGGHFSDINGNLIDGASSALTVDSLSAAITLMRTMRDKDGNDLDLIPRYLVAPPELEVQARQILNSEELAVSGATGATPTGNALRNSLSLVVEPRLSNAAKWPGLASGKAWFLAAGRESAAVLVAFLNGRRVPTFEALGMSDPDNLNFHWRAYFDYGASLGDPRAMIRSAGE